MTYPERLCKKSTVAWRNALRYVYAKGNNERRRWTGGQYRVYKKWRAEAMRLSAKLKRAL